MEKFREGRGLDPWGYFLGPGKDPVWMECAAIFAGRFSPTAKNIDDLLVRTWEAEDKPTQRHIRLRSKGVFGDEISKKVDWVQDWIRRAILEGYDIAVIPEPRTIKIMEAATSGGNRQDLMHTEDDSRKLTYPTTHGQYQDRIYPASDTFPETEEDVETLYWVQRKSLHCKANP
ncbi:MAG: hypothetical protein MMC23_005675 [Stictis urceolatum]|nr:hypothetical protein [Stictis urceolata]